MDYQFSDELKSMTEMARKFALGRLASIPGEDYEKGIVRRSVIEEMGRLGFFGSLVPERYGGTEAGYLCAVLMAAEIAKVSASYAGFFMCQGAGPPLTILKYGREDQKEKYIAKIISGEFLAFFAATEPDAGSDIAAMRTTATDQGDHYVISGTKTWVTNATIADVGLIWVYTDKKKGRNGISCFILDPVNANGISKKKIDKMGLRCSDAGEVALEDVRVPKENLLGNLGIGYEILLFTLSNTRLFAAARALGLASICLEESLKYARERNQFGQPIGEFQMIQDQLAQMYIEHQAAKSLVYQVARDKDKGLNSITDLAVAKYFACEAGVKAALTAMRIHSSYGFSVEYPIHRFVRDAMAFPITEGTANVQKMIIARSILKR